MTELNIHTPAGMLADSDISTKQFTFVKLNTTARQVAAATVEGERCFGVLQNKPDAANDPAEVRTHGTTKIKAGGTVTAGDYVGTDSAGKAITMTDGVTGQDVGQYILGEALTGGASGEIIEILLRDPRRIGSV